MHSEAATEGTGRCLNLSNGLSKRSTAAVFAQESVPVYKSGPAYLKFATRTGSALEDGKTAKLTLTPANSSSG